MKHSNAKTSSLLKQKLIEAYCFHDVKFFVACTIAMISVHTFEVDYS